MLVIQKIGGDDEDDPLLNPAHALIAKEAEKQEMANNFINWLVSESDGQKLVRNNEKNGVVLYSGAPQLKTPQAKLQTRVAIWMYDTLKACFETCRPLRCGGRNLSYYTCKFGIKNERLLTYEQRENGQ